MWYTQDSSEWVSRLGRGHLFHATLIQLTQSTCMHLSWFMHHLCWRADHVYTSNFSSIIATIFVLPVVFLFCVYYIVPSAAFFRSRKQGSLMLWGTLVALDLCRTVCMKSAVARDFPVVWVKKIRCVFFFNVFLISWLLTKIARRNLHEAFSAEFWVFSQVLFRLQVLEPREVTCQTINIS